MDDEREPSRPRYEVEYHVTSSRDNNARFAVRRNAKVFHIRITPSQFINSPATTEKYLSYLEVLRSGEEVIDDIFDTDVFEWVARPFEPFFAELAPSPVPPGQHADIKATLQDYLFPEFFLFELDIVDEELRPRRIEMERSPYQTRGVWLDDDDFYDDLKTWTALYDPGSVVLSFKNPEDALFKPPRKVLIDDGRMACFFKQSHSTVQTTAELHAYRKIIAANLDPQLYICRLHGIVINENGSILGMLLTYIDHSDGPLCMRVSPDYPPASVRQRWANQLDDALANLHKAGVVWGDVKAENVLIDQDDNAWILDFGGGYTRRWVDEQMAGTVEGDLAGMVKLKEFIFQDEAQDRWWTR